MDRRIFHGEVQPIDIARSLIGQFNRGDWVAQQIGMGDQIVVQIVSRDRPASGGKTALAVTLQKVADGVAVQMGKQAWLGIAASIGWTALTAWRNPLNLLGRLDDIAQDIENFQLADEVWLAIEKCAGLAGAGAQLSERLRRTTCPYCDSANPVGEAVCVACGAPLGKVQPETCLRCGFVVKGDESKCPNCGELL